MSKIKVSVIIANHRWDDLFKKTILSLLKVTNLELTEVIVVNNGLEAEKAGEVGKWLSHFTKASRDKKVRLLQIQEGNPSKARNVGVSVARGKYLVFLDNDTKLVGGLGKVVKYLDKHPKVGAGQLKLLRMNLNMRVTNSHVYDSAGEMLTSSGFLVERAREAKDEGQFDKPDLIFSGKGAGMVVRREVFLKVGGFDEDYVYYWEEPDLMWRVWKASYEVRFLWMGMVEHAYGTKAKPIPKQTAADQVYLACRIQMMTIYKNAEGKNRRRMLWRVGLSWLGLQAMFLLKGQWQQSRGVERGFLWLMRNGSRVKRKRRWVKKHLKGDDQWMEKVLMERDYRWYLGKAMAYVSGRPF